MCICSDCLEVDTDIFTEALDNVAEIHTEDKTGLQLSTLMRALKRSSDSPQTLEN